MLVGQRGDDKGKAPSVAYLAVMLGMREAFTAGCGGYIVRLSSLRHHPILAFLFAICIVIVAF